MRLWNSARRTASCFGFAPLGHGMRLGLSRKSGDFVNRPEGWKVADAGDAASGGTLRRGSATPSNAGPARETRSTSPRFRTTRLTEPIAFRLGQRLNEVVKAVSRTSSREVDRHGNRT